MTVVCADLFSWRARAVQDIHLDAQAICGFDEHSSELATAEDTDDLPVHNAVFELNHSRRSIVP